MIKSEIRNNLIVILGPTAIGKTDVAIKIAKKLNTEILSSDSRQFYKELVIGTAPPDEMQLNEVKHHFIGNKSIYDYYNVSIYENEVLQQLQEIFKNNNKALLVGGSGLYINAVCNGIDDIPDIDADVRNDLVKRLEDEGLSRLRYELKTLDPDYYNEVDLKNKKRIIRALEVCISTGKPFSNFRTQNIKNRNFKIIKVGLNIDREILYNNINFRVDKMIEAGLVEEAKSFYENRKLNTLNTVGYKELFEFFDGNINLENAINLIKQNTRHFAKRQLSWFKRDNDITWFKPDEIENILSYIDSNIE